MVKKIIPVVHLISARINLPASVLHIAYTSQPL